jgi:hypothetical protein
MGVVGSNPAGAPVAADAGLERADSLINAIRSADALFTAIYLL